MKLSVQTDNVALLPEAVRSTCHGIRFGSEFCEHLLPNLHTLERAHGLARDAGKSFTYVTPRLSNAGVERLEGQLPRLNEQGEMAVVVNDFGALHLLKRYPNLSPHVGRHLFMVRARSPWLETHIRGEKPGSSRCRWVEELYATTSLNYQPTLELYGSLGCHRADMDWIPRIFPSLSFLVSNGWHISVHLGLVPATFTRRCHTARFLGETSPERCSRPCLRRAFLLRNEILEEFGLEFILHGNAVFRLEAFSRADIAELERVGATEVILTMNPVTRIHSTADIQEVMGSLL
jgi:collagenase-like PrtC family protease